MNILVTGSEGFIGKNLISELNNHGYTDIYKCDISTTIEQLDYFAKSCNFVFHLAGVNRPKTDDEFMAGNFGFMATLLDLLKKHNNNCPILITSSVQAEKENPYGISKKAGEELIFSYGKETGAKVFVYRLSNVFGKWCRPNYNSAVATFCYNIANNLPITVNDYNAVVNLVYIDDIVNEFINALKNNETRENEFCVAKPIYQVTLKQITDLLYSFKDSRTSLLIADMSVGFEKKLYSTYLSYLDKDDFKYPLKMNVDNRGSFTELIKSPDRGQISVNISKPGITKGNHWHHTKNEKFLVVSGNGVIRFRKIDNAEIIEYYVSGEKLEVVDIPVGYTHNIENLGSTDMITIMWVNECFDPDKPDTYYMEV